MYPTIWYINIDGSSYGPYNVLDLRHDSRVTPDTLVWKEGFNSWIPIRSVPELKEVFEDSQKETDIPPKQVASPRSNIVQDDELALDMHGGPPEYLWAIILILILTYVLIQFFWLYG